MALSVFTKGEAEIQLKLKKKQQKPKTNLNLKKVEGKDNKDKAVSWWNKKNECWIKENQQS